MQSFAREHYKRATLYIEFISPCHMLHNSDITHVTVLAGGKGGRPKNMNLGSEVLSNTEDYFAVILIRFFL